MLGKFDSSGNWMLREFNDERIKFLGELNSLGNSILGKLDAREFDSGNSMLQPFLDLYLSLFSAYVTVF